MTTERHQQITAQQAFLATIRQPKNDAKKLKNQAATTNTNTSLPTSEPDDKPNTRTQNKPQNTGDKLHNTAIRRKPSRGFQHQQQTKTRSKTENEAPATNYVTRTPNKTQSTRDKQ